MTDMAAKTVLITGSTDGVGKLVARKFVDMGARVLLHGRDGEKGKQVVEELRSAKKGAEVEFYKADFSALAEVRAMADAIKAKHKHLDILINNAGVGGGAHGALLSSSGAVERTEHAPANPTLEKSRDGYELRFAVNYLADFLLTTLLLPILRNAPGSRIVHVSSIGQSAIDFDDIMLNRGQDSMHAYRQSKFAQVMFSFELAERAKDITTVALHPASFMNTKMVLESGITPKSTVEEGAEAIVHAALDPALEKQPLLFLNGKQPAKPREEQAYDAAARRKFWDVSLSYVTPYL